ncbi:MAG: putative OmpR family two-component system response regulator [Parcubacteria group bacterium Gr01-1014_33]|nr:MAG: putative OmpR family two-component system response regulator [Parcubacteria group bacterium Gr01-1014_33]
MVESAKKILIVDDDPFILDMYVLKFKEHGFQVEVAHEGKEGIVKAKEFQPDVILLDVVMPAMDGFDVLKKLKENVNGKTPKLIFLTNFGQREDVERGMRLGADDYIIKAHFTPTEIVTKVKEVLEKP